MYTNQRYPTYNGLAPKKDGWVRPSHTYGHVHGRPVTPDSYTTPAHTTEAYIIQTETIVQRPVPSTTLGEYKHSEYKRTSPTKDTWCSSYQTSPNHHHRPEKVEEFITKIQTEASQPRPKRFTLLSARVWRQNPSAPVGYHGHGQSPNYQGHGNSGNYHGNLGGSHSPKHHGNSGNYLENHSRSHSPDYHSHGKSGDYHGNHNRSHSPEYHNHGNSSDYHGNHNRSHSPNYHNHGNLGDRHGNHNRSHSPNYHNHGNSDDYHGDHGRSHSPNHYKGHDNSGDYHGNGISNGYHDYNSSVDGDYDDKNKKEEYYKPNHHKYDDATRPSHPTLVPTTRPSYSKPNSQVGLLSKPTNDIGQAIEYLKEAVMPTPVHTSPNSRFTHPVPPLRKKPDSYEDTIDRKGNTNTRRYGNHIVPSRPVGRYASAINSEEAVRRYGGATV